MSPEHDCPCATCRTAVEAGNPSPLHLVLRARIREDCGGEAVTCCQIWTWTPALGDVECALDAGHEGAHRFALPIGFGRGFAAELGAFAVPALVAIIAGLASPSDRLKVIQQAEANLRDGTEPEGL